MPTKTPTMTLCWSGLTSLRLAVTCTGAPRRAGVSAARASVAGYDILARNKHSESIFPNQHSFRRRFNSGSSGNGDGKDMDPHAQFKEQMRELQEERAALFGPDADSPTTSSSNPLMPDPEQTPSGADRHEDFETQLREMQEERERMFEFEQEEYTAWSTVGGGDDKLSDSLMKKVQEARAAATTGDNTPETISVHKSHDDSSYRGLTHLSGDGESVNMVDVGDKAVTKRVARAETQVVFPPEVVEALQLTEESTDVMGPKGPIFATAKIAGIMAAK